MTELELGELIAAGKGGRLPRRAALFIAMNDMVVNDAVVIPVINRRWVAATSHKLSATLSGWDSDFWNLKDWYREG